MRPFEIGDIYVYAVSLTDENMKKPRPVLIISSPNSKGHLSAIVGSSSAHSSLDEPWGFHVTQKDLEETILQDDIYFPISQQLLISPRFLRTKLGFLTKQKRAEVLKKISLRQTEIYYHTIHKPIQQQIFEPGESRISYAGRVFDDQEMINLVDSSLVSLSSVSK